MITLYPQKVYNELSEYVIGQEYAKKLLCNALFLHECKIKRLVCEEIPYGPKSNLLLVGPTGCGKTHMLKSLERIYPGLGILHLDATQLTKTGFEGNSLDSLIANWIQNTGNIYGIVFIDEIDKLCARVKTTKTDDWNKELQQNILKIVEGTSIYGRHGNSVDTSNLLFIFGGNFPELREEKKSSSIGFCKEDIDNEFKELHEKLVEVNIIPELAGRISQVVELQPLSKESLKNIFYSHKGCYNNYIDLFDFAGESLDIPDREVDLIIEKAYTLKTGARGLQSGLDDYLSEYIFNIEEKDIPNG